MRLALGIGFAAVALVALAFALWAPHAGIRRGARWVAVVVALGALLAWSLGAFA